jgi:hypothetical protein
MTLLKTTDYQIVTSGLKTKPSWLIQSFKMTIPPLYPVNSIDSKISLKKRLHINFKCGVLPKKKEIEFLIG